MSLHTSLSRVFEKVMYNITLRHLNDNILVEEQFGFRKNITTKTATYELINEMKVLLVTNGFWGGIFCDFAKSLV
jgi:hypothetical protein